MYWLLNNGYQAALANFTEGNAEAMQWFQRRMYRGSIKKPAEKISRFEHCTMRKVFKKLRGPQALQEPQVLVQEQVLAQEPEQGLLSSELSWLAF